MSDAPPPREPEWPVEPPVDPDLDSPVEFDRPFTTAPRPSLAPRLPGVARATLFLIAALLIGSLVGQTIGFVAALLIRGEPLPLRDPGALQDAIARLLVQPLVVFSMGVFSLLLTLAVTLVFTRIWEQRPLASVGLKVDRHTGRQFAAGLALGAGLIGAVFLVEAALSWLRVTHALLLSRSLGHIVVWFVVLLPLAATEEVTFRGYTFQALEEQWGGGAATAITAILFGAVHGFNPNAGWASFWGILASGVLFGVAFLVTRRLWLPIGLHVAWNLFEGPVLGFSVSGLRFPSAITSTFTGPSFWTGGSFGPEAGLLGILASAAGAAVLLASRRLCLRGSVRFTRRGPLR